MVRPRCHPAVIGGLTLTFRVSDPHSRVAVYTLRESYQKPWLTVQYHPPNPVPENFVMYIPIKNAPILMEKPTANFGRDDQLKVDGYDGMYNSLLCFSLLVVEKGTVQKATLHLYVLGNIESGRTSNKNILIRQLPVAERSAHNQKHAARKNAELIHVDRRSAAKKI